jgi:hypothetical protein
MNKAAKTIDRMRANPKDWRIEQIQTVAKRYGMTWRQDGTSHCVFMTGDGRTLPIPAHRPIKPIYITMFLELIDSLPEQNEE